MIIETLEEEVRFMIHITNECRSDALIDFAGAFIGVENELKQVCPRDPLDVTHFGTFGETLFYFVTYSRHDCGGCFDGQKDYTCAACRRS